MSVQFYQTLKLLHILGVILFVGNIIVTGFWKTWAVKTRDPKIVAFSQRLVTRTDLVFTTVGAVLVFMTGLTMASTLGPLFWRTSWLAWGFGLFAASGIIWVAILIPIQLKQASLAKAFQTASEIPQEYFRLERLWMGFGIIATGLPLVNVYLMVFKPS